LFYVLFVIQTADMPQTGWVL